MMTNISIAIVTITFALVVYSQISDMFLSRKKNP